MPTSILQCGRTITSPTLALSKSGYRSKVILSSQPVLQAPFFHLHLSYTPILKDSKDIRHLFSNRLFFFIPNSNSSNGTNH